MILNLSGINHSLMRDCRVLSELVNGNLVIDFDKNQQRRNALRLQ